LLATLQDLSHFVLHHQAIVAIILANKSVP
jgi:hypothetical protein